MRITYFHSPGYIDESLLIAFLQVLIDGWQVDPRE